MEQLRRRAATICILVIAAFPSGSARAQQEDSSAPLYSYFLGYAVNLPEQELGFVFGLEQSSLYIDVKVSIGVPGTATDNYYEDLTVSVAEAWGHTVREETTGYFSLNVGMTQRVARRLTVYGGIGICAVQVYRKYFDPALLLGSNGEYWIDGAAEERRTNFLAGVLVPVSPRIQVQAGVETMPRGFTIGLAWLTHGRR